MGAAHFLAWCRCMFHWSESTCSHENQEGTTTFIGTCTGTYKQNTLKIVKTYYGKAPEVINHRRQQ